MSYGREILDNWMIDEAVEDIHIEQLLKNKQWEIRSGKVLYIKDMETSHIKNCLNKIEKSNYQWRCMFYRLLKNELENRQEEL